jgi:hypothetical protein
VGYYEIDINSSDTSAVLTLGYTYTSYVTNHPGVRHTQLPTFHSKPEYIISGKADLLSSPIITAGAKTVQKDGIDMHPLL